MNKRVAAKDAIGMYYLGSGYYHGLKGFPKDINKALELFHRAGELGCTEAYNNMGYAYYNGEGVKVDEEKAKHYWVLGAIGGDTTARHTLGEDEEDAGDVDRALKHYMIAAEDGNSDSLNRIKDLYLNEIATKEDYSKALQSYRKYLHEIESSQRDEAAAIFENHRYH